VETRASVYRYFQRILVILPDKQLQDHFATMQGVKQLMQE